MAFLAIYHDHMQEDTFSGVSLYMDVVISLRFHFCFLFRIFLEDTVITVPVIQGVHIYIKSQFVYKICLVIKVSVTIAYSILINKL